MSELLPEKWVATTIGEVTINTTQRQPQQDESFVYIDIGSIDRETKRISTPQRMLGQDAPSRARKVVQTGDVLVSTTRPNLNAVAMVPDEFNNQIASTGFDVLRAPDIDPRWLFYTVRTTDFVQSMSELVQGALYPAVRPKDIRFFEMPLAPLNEQKRIADKLDRLLARVDTCRERCDRIPLILKRFRQSVLSAATLGQLTEDWRTFHQRPFNWQKVRMADVGELGRGKSKHRPRNDPRLYGGSYPFVQTGDIARSKGFVNSHSQTYSEFGLSQSKLWTAGTVCITIAANIADTAILAYPACFPDSVVGFVADPQKSLPQFIKWSIDVIRDELETFAPATAQKNINLAVLNNVEFECPPLEEQQEIVRRVETLFSFADRLEARHQTARTQVDHLTPALLDKAFRGELVPQDPNDEPASVLLEQIRSELTAAKANKPERGQRVTVPSIAKVIMLTRKDIQPSHLSSILKARGPLTAENLWTESQLEIDDFYDQLKDEEGQGLLRETGAEDSNTLRQLEAA